MFVYSRGAIDFWPGWILEKDYQEHLKRDFSPDDRASVWQRYKEFRAAAEKLASKVGWEGDMREGPYIAGLPTADLAHDGKIMIAWKQDNNGDTFVASPYRLPWLEGGTYGEWTQG